MNFKQAVPREIKGEWVILEKKDGTKFGVKLAPGNDAPPILPGDQPWEKHHMIRWTKTHPVKGRTDAHIAECDWDVPFLRGETTTIINDCVVATPDIIPASKIEEDGQDAIDSIGWIFFKSWISAMGRHEKIKGLTVGELALMIVQHPEAIKEAMDKGTQATAQHLLEKAVL